MRHEVRLKPEFSWQYRVLEAALITAAYFALARVGQLTAIPPGNVTAVYPPAGFAAACVLLRGNRVWPGLLLGQFMGNVWAFFDPGTFTSGATTITVGLAMSVGAVVQALAGAFLIQRFCGTRYPFDRVAHVFVFTGSAIAACLLSSTFGVTSLCAGGVVEWTRYGYTWWTWYLGDTAGFIVLASVLVTLSHQLDAQAATDRQPHFPRSLAGLVCAGRPSAVAEAIAIAVVGLAFACAVFMVNWGIHVTQPLAIFVAPALIIWTAIRFEQSGVAVFILIISVMACWGTASGFGPFAIDNVNLSLLSLTLSMSGGTLMGLVVAAAYTERVQVEEQLRSLNETLEDRVQQRTMELTEQQERVRLLLSSTAEAIYGLNLQGNCTFCNPACVEMLGYDTTDDLHGQNMHKLIHHTRPGGQAYPEQECRIYQAFRQGEGTHVDDEVLWRADGASFPAEYWSYPVRRDGEVVGSVVTFLDISERRRTEQQRDQHAEELQRSNRELEMFSYSVSHDLRAPLRSVRGFAEILAQRYHDRLDEKGQRYLNNIVQAGDNMDQLIDDLLAYSRVGSQGVRLIPVTLSDVLQRVCGDLAGRLEQTDAGLTIANGFPTVRANNTLLSQIFSNLFVNALTYQRLGATPQIDVRWQAEADRIVVAVQDNGIGIAPEFHEKIFDIFQRLHPQDKYPGTGIGLGIVRKAAHLLGGRVRVESAIDQGSTFYVELPYEPDLANKRKQPT